VSVNQTQIPMQHTQIRDRKVPMSSQAGVATGQSGYRASPRPEVQAFLPPLIAGSKVLEIGCGEGAFSMTLPGEPETWGVEPDAGAAAIAGGRLFRVFANTFEEVESKLPAAYFDLVICNDVIEHMTDHDAFLRSIQKYMAPGSHLVGSVPNVRFYGNLFNLIVARDWHYADNGILDRTHFRFFTFRSFRRSLENAGLEVKRLEGLNEGLRLDWHLRTLAERLFRMALIVLSLGKARDIKFLQIGFLAIPGGP
jgi:2-polyprenyl-3-methyl-5-hydroxy-6-metoxy-1,4-benzoquinol methylase